MAKPRDMSEWMRWAELSLARATKNARSVRQVPIGGLILLAGADIPEGWLLANGIGFDADEYPFLYDQLGSSILPNVTSTGGLRWIIRAE